MNSIHIVHPLKISSILPTYPYGQVLQNFSLLEKCDRCIIANSTLLYVESIKTISKNIQIKEYRINSEDGVRLKIELQTCLPKFDIINSRLSEVTSKISNTAVLQSRSFRTPAIKCCHCICYLCVQGCFHSTACGTISYSTTAGSVRDSFRLAMMTKLFEELNVSAKISLHGSHIQHAKEIFSIKILHFSNYRQGWWLKALVQV